MELGRFHIEYEPRTAIKGQVLADFIAEFTGTEPVEPTNELHASTGGQETVMEEADHLEPVQSSEQSMQAAKTNPGAWILYIDGSSTASGSGVGIVFKMPEGAVIEQAV